MRNLFACLLVLLALTAGLDAGAGPVAGVSRARAEAGSFGGVTSIAAGTFHACALRIDGTVWCWGENGNGQLGIGSNADKNVPVRVPGIEDAIAITAGGSDAGAANGYTCALLRDSSVWCWGDNLAGQLGDGSTTDRPSPVLVAGNHTFKQISAGRFHTCGVKFSGEAYCWGQNTVGQLGTGNNDSPQSTPVAMTGGLAANVIEVSAGGGHTCGRTAPGQVYCTGGDASGQLGDGPPGSNTSTPAAVSLSIPAAITAGGFHTCARLITGVMRCWGSDSQGELGNGATTGSQFSPVTVVNVTDVVALGETSLGAHQCAVLVTTRVACWGNNDDGQLGDGGTADSDAPVSVQSTDSDLNTIIEVAGGLNFTCALSVLGEVWCWGDNAFGQLGNGSNEDSPWATRAAAPEMMGQTHVRNGEAFTCFNVPLTRPRCAGENISGQLGDGTQAERLQPVLAGSGPAVAIDAGGFQTCMVRVGGTVSCWGSNAFGQLGNGNNDDSAEPVLVAGLTGIVEVSTGLRHTCALRYDGAVSCWGANHQGQLGTGNNDHKNTPTAVQGVLAVEIATGDLHTCARAPNGQVACWGDNVDAQLGNSSTTDSNVPTDVGDEDNAIALAAGGAHTCVVIAHGVVRCWGRGDEGQIGNGRNTDANNGTPVAGTGPAGLRARDVVLGFQHSCALFQLGLVACWGENGLGQLGDKTNDDRNTPVFAGVIEASVISAGGATSCAKIEDDRVRCWGSNGAGQFGNGTKTGSGDGVAVDTGLDSDTDGCADAEELDPNPLGGGDREFAHRWDYYDVTGDAAVDLADVVAILQLFGATPGSAGYLSWFDRIAPDASKRYRTALATAPSDLGVDVADAILNLASFGHSCAGKP